MNYVLNDVSFEVRAGEILGVGGLPDSGKDALGEALFGLYPREGRVAIDGAETPADALASIRCGMAFVPADRRGAGGTRRANLARPGLFQRLGHSHPGSVGAALQSDGLS